MNLIPKRPPGPNLRKALAYSAEVWRLRSQGYTFEAIREALAGEGIHVSNSTVQREVARAIKLQASAGPPVVKTFSNRPDQTPAPAPAALERSVSLQGASTPADRSFGREFAEAFVSTQITNPLIRAKEKG